MTVKRKYGQMAGPAARLIAAAVTSKLGQMVSSNKPQLESNTQYGEGKGIASTIGPDHKFRQSYRRRQKRRLPYKQKRKLRAKQKRWKTFKKKVKRASSAKMPLMTVNLRKNTIRPLGTWPQTWDVTPTQISNVTNDASDLMLWETSFGGSSSVVQTSTIFDIFRETFAGLQTRWGGTDIAQGSRSQMGAVYITYAELQFTIRNDNIAPINYDIWEFVAARDMSNGDAFHTPGAAMTHIQTNQTSFGAGFSSLAQTTRGVTPFDFPTLGRHWKILSKQTVLLGAGETACLSYKGSKGIYSALKATQFCAIKGKTKHIIIYAGTEVAFGCNITTSGGQMTCNKTYHWKPLLGNTAFTQGVYQAVVDPNL